ncbi:FAD NAD(P)-binding domain-containing protein [Raphidocelis subcapitata]|uniref:FAD NAD(P)-binding domain-containing protein n=1 Tax=Raphidocelis subcapitata TaxID=307507 RepID=A0A2V0NL74_9CHLO|nr:FAD NAD(P)-binding domain-containing protein [Raphidocelis subcapitata]|eukprot:GBF88144.1 FAD NAD(P)-binding domain-containing protein [Raphidocelis subcapitata]
MISSRAAPTQRPAAAALPAPRRPTVARPARRGGAAAAAAAAAGAAPPELDVAIAGAGPAGLAAAAALRRADPSLRVGLFERTPMTARGAGVLVGVNGLLALNAINPAIVEGLLARAIKLEGSERYSCDTGEYLEFQQMPNDKFKDRYGFTNALLGWADITAALQEQLPPGSVRSGAAVSGFERLPDGRLSVLGPAGAPLATARALVGADGWFSALRGALRPGAEAPTFKEIVVWRARLPRRDEWLDNPGRTKWWVPAKQHPGSLLAVLIPVPGGDLVWQCHAPMSLMRERGLAFDPITGEGASSHSEGPRARASDGAAAASDGAKARCLRAFEGFPGLARFLEVVEATPDDVITEHGLYQHLPDQIPQGHWGSGMVTLAGDAAHTATVDGTGMAQAFEDAAVLGKHVQQSGLSEASLRAYEAERARRVRAVFSMANRHGGDGGGGGPAAAV